ncbi:36108_t:CDS:2, partial [Gigaspora margarita]
MSQDELIIIYGGIQVEPDVATLNVNVEPYIWKAVTTNTTNNAPIRSPSFHSAI